MTKYLAELTTGTYLPGMANATSNAQATKAARAAMHAEYSRKAKLIMARLDAERATLDSLAAVFDPRARRDARVGR